MNEEKRLQAVMLFMRITVFAVMLVWTLDKVLRPDHAATVYAKFYFLGGIGTTVMYAIGVIELVILAGFIAGIAKRFTYGAVLLFHAVSTLSSYEQYLQPFKGGNIMFYAAWPMLGACTALYALRHRDTFLSFGEKLHRAASPAETKSSQGT